MDRYLETSANATLNNGRSSHTIGKLGRIIKVIHFFYRVNWKRIFFDTISFTVAFHCIGGKIGCFIFNFLILQENDDFFELISSKFLSDNRYSTSIRAASARLLLSCSATLMVSFLFIGYFSFLKRTVILFLLGINVFCCVL